MATFTPNDPLYTSQWYLKNTGQRYANPADKPAVLLDLNIESVWAKGINGAGVIIGVADDGIDLNHPDLQASLLKDQTFNLVNKAVGAGAYNAAGNFNPTADQHSHGTVVGSIATATGNNAEGITGIAFGSKLVSTLVIHTPNPAVEYSTVGMFTHLLNSNVGVSINSYGLDPAFSENYYIAPGTPDANLTDNQKIYKEMQTAASNGRGGLGMVIEVSAGNEAANKADAGMTGFTNNRFTITSGAVTELGKATAYTSPGASVLVSAFGGVGSAEAGVNAGFGVISADVSGAAGDNKAEGAAGNYSFQNQGTSYSGPMVGATAALMLQANPNLGFRDVSNILAMTARGVAPADNAYVNNAATDWNLGGMHFSRQVGFGLIDVAAAVQLAQSWSQPAKTAANWVAAEGTANVPAPQTIAQNETGTAIVANVATNVSIERLEFDLNITSTLPSQLRAEITSPGGTTITLFNTPLTQAGAKNEAGQFTGPETAWPGTFQIGSTAFLGEKSQGNWTLKLFDVVNDDVVATVNSLTVRAWGSTPTDNNEYIFTEEYASAGRSIANDTVGTDTINAAATHSRAFIDLTGANASTVGAVATAFNITNSTIENAIGGAGNDFLFGNALNNFMRGNSGVDVLLMGAGEDTGYGGDETDYLYGGDGNDVLHGEAGDDAFFGEVGHDIFVGGVGADYIDAGDGFDYADGGDASDVFLMKLGNDTAMGQAGNDYFELDDGDDTAYGGLGADIMLGGQGNDVLVGEADADYIDAGAGFDYADGGDGNDIFLLGAGNDTALGRAGNDYFDMGDGDDTANGGAGDDIFLGGAGNDVVEAGLGLDVAVGGTGNDSYVVRSTDGLLLIYDFVAGGTDDVLRLMADTGISSFAQAQSKLSFNAASNASILTVDADTSVWLVGVSNAQLTAADFAFA